MAVAASSTATAIYKYTYTLGRSLYVPVTSRCNSIPLPSTRGPNFLLPRKVAEGLLRVRAAETAAPEGAAAGGSAGLCDDYNDWMEEHDDVVLHPYDLPLVNGLYDFGDDLKDNIQRQRQNEADQRGPEIDDFLQPSIATLVDEVSARIRNSNDDSEHGSPNEFDQVVIAGEGEPTLRMDALLAVARSVQKFRTENDGGNERSGKRSRRKGSYEPASSLPVRVITNGLCFGVPNLGYSPYNNSRSSSILPLHRHVVLKDMMDAGVSQLSVALNTANRHEYDVLMEPCCHTGGGLIGNGRRDAGNSNIGSGGSSTLMPGTAHDIVCEFIMEATKAGMDVDITGVLRPEVDRDETERLARLLLSVGSNKQRRKVRWRQYFA